jgi:parvulin-like peptidyl-prolyl isomerase
MAIAKKATKATKKPVAVKAAKKTKTVAQLKTSKKAVVKVAPVSKLAAALKQAKGLSAKTATTSAPAMMMGARSKMSNKFLIAAWILVIAGALYYFKGQFVVATVNGQPIFRSTLIRELEAQSGPQILDSLVLETLVRQEAAARKITVSDQEITDETKKLEAKLAAQQQNLDQLLAVQGMTRPMLKEQLRLQLMVEKMVDRNSIVVSDDEVKKYFEDNKAFLPKNIKQEELAPEVKAQLQQQKATAKTQEFFKTLQTKAKVNHWLFPTTVTAPSAPAAPAAK